MSKLCLKGKVSTRALCWLCVAALLISLTPLYALSFYNHACYDDFGFSLLTHAAWRDTGSLWETLKAAVNNTVGIRQTWEGTYATSFLSTFQPALFGENLYWLTTALLLSFFLFALWFFLRQALVRELGADRQAFLLCFASVAFAMIQLVPEMSEAFFWFNGGVAYTFLWSVMLVRVGVWLCLERTKRRGGKVAYYALLLLLTVIVGGAKYSTLLFACLLDGLFLFRAFCRKKPERYWECGLTALLLMCFAFSALAPGNAVRSATLSGGMSAPKAILQAVYFGLALMGHWFSLPLLVVWALVVWQVSEALLQTPMRFSHPVFITGIAVGLFCAQLAPTLFTGNYLGDGRVLNTYFFTFVLLSCALALYWAGWWLRQGERKTGFPAIGTAKRDWLSVSALAVVLALLVVGVVGYHPEGTESYGPQNTASGSALRSLYSGQAAAYDAAMDSRDAAMNDPEQPDVVLRPVSDAPPAFMGYAALSDMAEYVASLYAEYYAKQSVTIEEE